MNEQVKEHKAKVKELELQVAQLQKELAAAQANTELVSKNIALEVELRMRDKIEAAYDKGFNSCKAHFVALKELQSSLAI